jgi:hypothetical protein
MNLCEDCLSRIDFYLGDELRDEDLEIFNDHVEWCAFCRRQLAERRLVLESVRASRPLYVASSEFQARMAPLLEQEQSVVSLHNVQEIRPFSPSKRRAWLRLTDALAASVLFLAGAAVLWTLSERQARANAFLETAIVAHQREISGSLKSLNGLPTKCRLISGCPVTAAAHRSRMVYMRSEARG